MSDLSILAYLAQIHGQSRCVDQKIRASHQVEPDRSDPLTHLVAEAMMVPEEVQTGAHRGEHLVDLGFPRIRPPASGKRTERLRRLVRQEDVDAAQRLARLDLFADEMPTLVVSDAWATRGLKTPGYG